MVFLYRHRIDMHPVYSPTASILSLQPTLSLVKPLFDQKSTQKRFISNPKADSARMAIMVTQKMISRMATESQLQPALAMHLSLMLKYQLKDT